MGLASQDVHHLFLKSLHLNEKSTCTKHLQLECSRDLELSVATVSGRLVRAASEETAAVAKAVALHVKCTYFDFARTFHAQRLPRQIFLRLEQL